MTSRYSLERSVAAGSRLPLQCRRRNLHFAGTLQRTAPEGGNQMPLKAPFPQYVQAVTGD
jgi:hypothetical protein